MNPVVKIKDLEVVYDLGKSAETTALKNINLEIYPQEYVVFFGPSGCGKSTLLYAIAGLEKPTSGEVIVENKNINFLSEKELVRHHKQAIGIIFQAYYLINDLTVSDNILMPQILSGVGVSERKPKAQFLAKRFGIANLLRRYPQELSGGQQQRVAICRALVNNPSIILADEPVGNLDSKSAETVFGFLRELNEKDKKTIMLVTHDPRYLHFAHRVFHMKDGEIIQEVRNPKKPGLGALPKHAKKSSAALEKLAQKYPYLPYSKLQAKFICHNLFFSLGPDEEERFEKIIEEFLQKKISKEELLRLLDKPQEQGGMGFYSQRAQDIASKMERLMDQAEFLAQKPTVLEQEEPVSNLDQNARAVRKYILDKWTGNINLEQLNRLDKFIAKRISKQINKAQFQKVLDLPLKKGGVGLNRRTAKNFTKQLEAVLAL
jgi:ABC-type lipoprotein export system ATPase subunit